MTLSSRKNRLHQQPGSFNFKRKLTAVAIAASLFPSMALAIGEVTSINTSTVAAPDHTYTATDTNTYNWGLGDNLLLDGFVYAGDTYNYSVEADNVVLQRTPGGTPCSVFTQNNGSAYNYLGSFPDGSTGTTGICDMAAIVSGNVINTGALDVFANVNGNDKNIERIDFMFDAGITAPLDPALMDRAGHVVTEKSGNNAVKIAAVTAVDGSGNPTAYGTLVTVGASGSPSCATEPCYGLVGNFQDFDFLHSPDGTDLAMEQNGQSNEDLGMAFVTLNDLGITAGQMYYGFSYFASDVDTGFGADLTDITTFPLATDRGGAGNADIYGGTAGYFVWADLYDISGTVYSDTDGSGLQNGAEAGIADVTVELYNDTNTNGTFDDGTDLLAGTVITNASGEFTMPPVEDGTYFVKVDDSDTDLPSGGTIPTSQDPITVTVSGANVTGQDTGILTTPVGPVNAADETATTPVDQAVSIDVLANDTGTGLTITIDTPPSNGTATVVSGEVLYTPNAGFEGTDSFVYRITSSQGAEDTGTVTVTVANDPDNDGDGVPDAIDIDDDNDGIPDVVETTSDFDGDGIPNAFDLDSDNDGIPDIEESGLLQNTKEAHDPDSNAKFDSAGAVFGANGLLDAVETTADSGSPDYNGDGSADQPVDTDGDGKPNFLDIDSDGDGFKDVVEAYTDSNGDSVLVDSNDDGKVDNFTDPDQDGWDNNAAVAYASGLADSDGDDKADFCQCDCEAAPVHTGLEGSGAGALGWLMLPMIGGGLLRRRAKLKAAQKALPLAIATSLAAGAASAENSPADRDFDQRFYLGAGVGISMLDPDPECGCVTVDEDSDMAWQVMAGYDFSKRFTGELYYADLGEAELSTGDIGYQQYGLSLLGYFYNSRNASHYTDGFDDEGYYRREGLSAFGRIGFGGMENDSTLDIEQDNSTHVHLGAGLEYGWSNGFAGRLEFVSYDEDAQAIYLSLLKRFGEANPYAAPVVAAPVIKSEVKTKPKPALPPLELPVVHFGHDLTLLNEQDKAKLDELSEALKPRPNLKLEVRGHTDSDGTETYNQGLSERRADAVKRYLESNGASSEQLMPKGYSENQPVQSNATAEGKQENRRVDFEILSQ